MTPVLAMEDVEDALQQCSAEWACTSLERADTIVSRLEDSRDSITAILNDALAQSAHPTPELNSLVEIHTVISQLLVMWENTLERIQRSTGGGRPQKHVNVPLVRFCYMSGSIITSVV